MISVQIKDSPTLTIPKQASPRSSGYDIIATSDPRIEYSNNGGVVEYIEYETDIYLAPQVGYHTFIFPRSSISKTNLMLANSVGLCDNDYRGEFLCRFKYVWQPMDFKVQSGIDETMNEFMYVRGRVNMNRIYKKGDRIAQLVFAQMVQADYQTVNKLDETVRGTGGFGSTGL